MRAYGCVVLGVMAACVCAPVQGGSPRAPEAAAKSVAAADGDVRDDGTGAGLRTSGDLEPLGLPAFIPGQDDAIRLRETSGQPVTVRVTPVDEQGSPVDGGRVVVLRAGETRVVHLTDVLPLGDLIGRRLVVETLRGSGQAEIAAAWLDPAEAAALATAPHVPRRHLAGATPPTSEALIDAAETAGTLPHETAVLYRVYAIFGDARLPAAYRGNDAAVEDSLYLATVVDEWSSFSAATQAALQPFLVPPAYQQGYRPASRNASPYDTPPTCTVGNLDPHWDYTETTGGKVRVWFDVNAGDRAIAGVFLVQAQNTILPKLEVLMAGHPLLSDETVACNGGSGKLDIYLCDQPQSVTLPYGTCSNGPVFIRLRRDTSAALLAHEIFHAFEWSMPLAGCLSSPAYRWWAEASAQWVQDYVYPFDQAEHSAAPSLLSDPRKPLDLNNDPHWYGAYLLPFYVYRSTGSADFVRKSWEGCSSQSAVKALDAALPGGFDAVWPKFALHNWNQAPVDDYRTWDSLQSSVLPSVTTGNVDASSLPDHEATLTVDLPHLSATYKHFVFSGPEISSVAFWNGATYDLEKLAAATVGPVWNPKSASADATKGIKVQAMYKIDNAWTQEDWTGKPYVLSCRDVRAERLQELVIVVSNARIDDSAGTFSAPGLAPVLWVSGLGCYKWTGTTTYTEVGSVATQTDTVSNLVWTRIEEPQDPPTITYLPTGSVTVTMSGGCSGGGTVPLSGLASDLVTYNYVPSDSPARKSYRGQGAETATVPVTCQGHPGATVIGPWFLIYPPSPPTFPFFFSSFDGKHLTGSYSPTFGVTWQWDLRAQQQ